MTNDEEIIDSIRGIVDDFDKALEDSWNKTDEMQLEILRMFFKSVKKAVAIKQVLPKDSPMKEAH